MMLAIFSEIFERDINKLIAEINLYKNEDDIWKVEGNISNSAGNLVLHLTGNLNHFICAILGNSGYVRNRDEEFSKRNVPREQMVADLKNTSATIKKTLSSIPEADLQKEFPVQIFNKTSTTSFVLVHLVTHLSYHLGQINYHRRLLD